MKAEQLLTDFIKRNEREIARLKNEISETDDQITITINKAMILAFETDLLWIRGMAELSNIQLNESLPFANDTTEDYMHISQEQRKLFDEVFEQRSTKKTFAERLQEKQQRNG